jgi:purine-binding chemotaxis protein CheW
MPDNLMGDNNRDLLLVTFRLANAWYGLDTNFVQEVILVGEITTVYHAPPYVCGIANLRGKIVTVLDLNLKLGIAQQEESEDSRILIVSWLDEQVGLLVECVGEVASLNNEQIEALPSNIGDGLSRYLKGVHREAQEDRLLGILDLERVLAETGME